MLLIKNPGWLVLFILTILLLINYDNFLCWNESCVGIEHRIMPVRVAMYLLSSIFLYLIFLVLYLLIFHKGVLEHGLMAMHHSQSLRQPSMLGKFIKYSFILTVLFMGSVAFVYEKYLEDNFTY
jgi:hypothetical protein